jgi:hypothetical protein
MATGTRTARPRKRRKPQLFGNPRIAKLGALIHTFSIPALKTCPGKSRLCALLCYANRGPFIWETVSAKHRANLARTRKESFVVDAVGEIRERDIMVLRLHMAGDFYTLAYIWKWVAIARKRPRTTFFVYTRSWIIEPFMPALITLAGLKNVQLWFSCDRDMPRPPVVRGVRTAYLLANDDDPASVPAWADLVFRDLEQGPLKRANGVLVCPYEQGIKRQVKLNCSRCRICWTPVRSPTHGQEEQQQTQRQQPPGPAHPRTGAERR